jgi:hypothetical protein
MVVLVIWAVKPCEHTCRYQTFGEVYCLHLQGWSFLRPDLHTRKMHDEPNVRQKRRKLLHFWAFFQSFIKIPLYQKPDISYVHKKFIKLKCDLFCAFQSIMILRQKLFVFGIWCYRWSTKHRHRDVALCLWHGRLSACLYVLLACVDRSPGLDGAPFCG